ncbi:MAG: prolipoprotein diacylglyceryl transferase [Gammaproteobacteria bacterium]|nr:prolipoprotein diacylglyceryl transferase [Gammaproteobacteria bacterium]
MLSYPAIDPVALALGPLQIHWYGLSYLAAFAAAWWLGRQRCSHPQSPIRREQMEDLLFYCALGVVLGGRLGYILFYNFAGFIHNPLVLLQIWQGGMSFHGGLIGVLIAMGLYARKLGTGFFQVADFVAPLVPVGLLSGRLGNFINAELWGGPTDFPLAMQVPCAHNPATEELCRQVGRAADGLHSLPVHASQLYEAGLEGALLFAILWWFGAKPRPLRAVSGLFLLGYGLFRFAIEFVRIPDSHLGYLAFDWLTMGQLLSTPMILFGLLLLGLAYRGQRSPAG